VNPKRGRVVLTVGAGLTVGLLVGVLALGPATAHFQQDVDHLYSHIKNKVSRKVVSETSEENSNTFKGFNVQCPGDRRVLGGGVHVGGAKFDLEPSAPVAIMTSQPLGGTQWRGAAREMSNTTANWNLTVYAICGNL
jgi:hypothetical protein